MNTIVLKGRTGRGLEQPEWSYKKYFVSSLSESNILMAKRRFSCEYGVELDRIEIAEIRKGT